MNKLKDSLLKFSQSMRQYVVIVVIIIFGSMYGFLIFTSGKQVENQPSDVQISEKFQGSSRPKIDDSIAQKLHELEDQNVEVKTIFEEARNNPFAE